MTAKHEEDGESQVKCQHCRTILTKGNGRERNPQDGHVYLRAVFALRKKRREELEGASGRSGE